MPDENRTKQIEKDEREKKWIGKDKGGDELIS